MRKFFRVTYDIVTPESAENGEADRGGYVTPGNWHFEVWPEDTVEKTEDIELTLKEALSLVSAGCMEDSGSWFTEVDSDQDYKTGEYETRSLHVPDNITQSSYDRIKRICCGRF